MSWAFLGRRRRRRAAVVAVATVAVTALGACSSAPDVQKEDQAPAGPPPSTDYFGYLVNNRLATTNAGTAFGNATSAEILSNRLYPAAFVPGPSGQMIPNTDLVETEEMPAAGPSGQRKVVFNISEDADFSDGTPVVCDDFLLAYKAGKLSSQFGSHMPLTQEISEFHCAPGNKRFMLVFAPDSGDRWRYLFGPGTVMPSHAIARKAGMGEQELFDALYNEDTTALEPVAKAWRYGYSTEKDEFDPELQVSYGPFAIERIGDAGEVVLKRNEEYYGDAANLERVVVWPSTANAEDLVAKGALRVADATSEDPEWLHRNEETNPFDVTPLVGGMTETLTLSQAGTFAEPWARQAFAACVDQARVAKVSSEQSGIEVPPAYLRTLRHDDAINSQLRDVADAHRAPDPALASQLGGTTIRVGYVAPDERYAAMVKEIAAMCEPYGITVEDQSAEYMSQHYLEMDPATWMPTIDAFLGPVDPMTEYTTPDADISRVGDIKKAEQSLWETVPSIPLSAQPRAFIFDREVQGVVPYTGVSGIGWNMDRWRSPQQQK